MRPLYRTWLELTGWFVSVVLWLFAIRGGSCWWQPIMIWLIFVGLFFLTKKLGYSPGALPFALLLILIGWVFLYRLDPYWAEQQFWGVLLGAIAYFIGLLIPFIELDVPLLWAGGALGLLIITAIFGQSIGGAKTWFSFGDFRFQPVEFARVLLILYLGRHLSNERPRKGMLLVLSLFFLLLAWQRDLGPALLVFLVFCGLSLYINFSVPKLLIYLGTIVTGFTSAILFFPHFRSRVLAWIWPWEYFDSKGYQVLQGLFALGSGGIIGRGIGGGLVRVIPEGHTDYLFAIIGEELGLLGTFSLILIYLALAFWSFRLLSQVTDKGQKTIGLGLTFLLHGQVFLVVGGILRLVPFTGMTLPLVSYGSNSLVAQLWMLGMLTSLRRE